MKLEYALSFAGSKNAPIINAFPQATGSCPFCRRHVTIALPSLGVEYDRLEALALRRMIDRMDALCIEKTGVSPRALYMAHMMQSIGDTCAVELLVRQVEGRG